MKIFHPALLLFALAGCERTAAEQPGEARTPVAPSAAAQAPTGPVAASGCALWGGRGFSLSYGDYASHAAMYRRFQYSDATGSLHVIESTLEGKVVDKTITLSPADRDAVAGELLGNCPTEKDLKRGNAPGGGTTLEVTARSGATTKIEAWDGASTVRAVLSRRFPELRQ